MPEDVFLMHMLQRLEERLDELVFQQRVTNRLLARLVAYQVLGGDTALNEAKAIVLATENAKPDS